MKAVITEKTRERDKLARRNKAHIQHAWERSRTKWVTGIRVALVFTLIPVTHFVLERARSTKIGYSSNDDTDDASTVQPEHHINAAQQIRTPNLVTGRIQEYSSLLNHPTEAGTFRRDGAILTESDIRRRLTKLRRY